jgi:hypothetical protein
LIVSPKGDRILYFIPNPIPADCVEYCGSQQVWFANADGSNAVRAGGLVSGGIGYIKWEWGADGFVYFTMIYADTSLDVIAFCGDNHCSHSGDITFPEHASYPAIRPDGKYMAIYRVDYDDDYTEHPHQSLIPIAQTVGIDLPLTAKEAPAVWSADGKKIYYFIYNPQTFQTNLAVTTLDDPDHAEILSTNFPLPTNPTWDIVPDLGIMLLVDRAYAVTLRCVQPS